MRRLRIVLAVAIAVCVSGCNKDVLKAAAGAVAVVQAGVQDAARQQFISEPDAAILSATCAEVSTVLASLREAVQRIDALSPGERKNAALLLAPVLEAIDQSENTLYRISDVKIRRAIQAGLFTMKTALALAQVNIEAA